MEDRTEIGRFGGSGFFTGLIVGLSFYVTFKIFYCFASRRWKFRRKFDHDGEVGSNISDIRIISDVRTKWMVFIFRSLCLLLLASFGFLATLKMAHKGGYELGLFGGIISFLLWVGGRFKLGMLAIFCIVIIWILFFGLHLHAVTISQVNIS